MIIDVCVPTVISLNGTGGGSSYYTKLFCNSLKLTEEDTTASEETKKDAARSFRDLNCTLDDACSICYLEERPSNSQPPPGGGGGGEEKEYRPNPCNTPLTCPTTTTTTVSPNPGGGGTNNGNGNNNGNSNGNGNGYSDAQWSKRSSELTFFTDNG